MGSQFKIEIMKTIKLFKETNEIQRVIALRTSRNKRHRYREFIIEGKDALDQAYVKGWKIKSLFFNAEAVLTPWAKRHLENEFYDVAYAVPTSLMQKMSEKEETPELIAIGEMQLKDFSTYYPKGKEVVLVLDEPKSAGNVGMMIRSAVAFGVSALVISGHAADEYDPKSIRASVGTFFSLPIYRVEGISRFLEKLEALKTQGGVQVIATGDRGDTSLELVSFTADLLFLVLGNETTGISVGYRQSADQFVQIPLEGEFTSLNIGAAGSILLYEIFRQRRSL